MTKKTIYLDNSATTKICPAALKKYCEVSEESFGNPSSLHELGFFADRVTDEARENIKRALSENDCTVVFTASGSEANNLAIIGRAFAKERFKGKKIITTDSEHASVLEPLRHLLGFGFRICYIPTKNGRLDEDRLAAEMDRDVFLVSMMLTNNETGAVYNLPRVATLLRQKSPDAKLHVDATQGFLKIPFTMAQLGADMITISSHKIEGPKGVGALVIKDELIKNGGISPIIFGGGQEGGLRSGTENVPGIAAFGEAVRIGHDELSCRAKKTAELRAYLLDRLSESDTLKGISPTLPKVHAPHIINLTLPGIKSETMLHFLSSEGIYVSSGSACSSNTAHVSSALTAYGRSGEEAANSVRISFSHNNEKEDVDALILALERGLLRLARSSK
jgi:cysteine desulfurase